MKHLAPSSIPASLVSTVLSAVCLTLSIGHPVQARTLTYTFEGVVDADEADRGWQTFEGTFTFPDTLVDGIPDVSTADYKSTDPLSGLTLGFDGTPPQAFNGGLDLLVSDNLGGADTLGILAFSADQLSMVDLSLSDFTQTLFNSDALPLPPGGLTQADFGWLTLNFHHVWTGTLQGHLTGLQCTQGCAIEPPTSAVPEPAALTLAWVGVSCLIGRRRAAQWHARLNK